MKKGLVTQKVATLTLFLLSVILILFIIGVTSLSATAQSAKSACQLNIQLKLFGERLSPILGTGTWLNPFEIYCPRKILLVEDSEAREVYASFFGKESRTSDYSFPIINEQGNMAFRTLNPSQTDFSERMSNALVHELAECWDLFLEGSKDILDSGNLFGRASTCFICAELFFSASNPVSIDLSASLQQRVPLLGVRGTYEEFLFNTQSTYGNCDSNLPKYMNMITQLDASENYAITFIRRGSGMSWVRGNTCQYVDIIPVTHLGSSCNILVN